MLVGRDIIHPHYTVAHPPSHTDYLQLTYTLSSATLEAATLATMTSPPVLILDNGAYSIKAGVSATDAEPRCASTQQSQPTQS